MKHTKGKWGVQQSGGKRAVVCNDMVIASDLYDENKSPSIEEVDANASLMVLAPEMLELLKDILAEVRPEISRVNEVAGHTIFNPVATETIDMAKELIDKAEGVM